MDSRPSWSTYFISIAYLSATRSIDPHTKHGCVITSQDNKILSIGYNGAASRLNNNKIPLTRPDKYQYILHAEDNAILNCRFPLDNSIFYITGEPCTSCLNKILQVGASKIVYGPKKSTQITEEIKKHIDFIVRESKIEYIGYNNMEEVKKLINI